MSRCCSEGYGSLGQFSDDPCLSGIYIWCYYLCWMVKVMFSSLLVYEFVCLFVCLLATLQENAWTDFHEIFRICWLWYKEQSGNFGGGMFNPLHTRFLFIFFQWNPCLWATLWKNGWMDFHEIFRKVGHETKKIWNIFGMLRLTHWGRDKIDAILQTTFSNAISWMKMFEFRLQFHWSLFLKVQLTIFQHWFR